MIAFEVLVGDDGRPRALPGAPDTRDRVLIEEAIRRRREGEKAPKRRRAG